MPAVSSRSTDDAAGLVPERCLPIRVPLRAGESLDSWLEALAARNAVPPAELLAALGLKSPRTPFGLMLGLAPESLRRIERQTGLGAGALDAAVLDPYLPFGVVAPARQALPHGLWRRWARGTGSGFCPACLAESGGRWQRRWHLRWSFVCRDHRSMLAAGCPRCARPPRSGEARWGRDGPSARCAHPDPDSTARTVARPRCDADLTTHPATRLDQEHPLLTAQAWIDALLDPDRADEPVTVAGVTAPRTVAVEAVAALIRALLAGRRDLSTHTLTHPGLGGPLGRRVVDGLTLPAWPAASTVSTALQAGTDPTLFGTAATLAVDALAHESLSAAADPVLHLLAGQPDTVEIDTASIAGLRLRHTTGRHSHGPTSSGDDADRDPGPRLPTLGDPIIDAVLLRRAAPTTRLAERLSYRTESPLPRRPPPREQTERRWPHQPGRASSIPARLIPQCAWPAVIDTLGCRTGRRDTIAFAATVSMALARIGTFAPWSQIALQLGLPSGLARRVNNVWQRLGDHGDDTPLLTTLDALVDALLERPPPIDYARRRWVFRTLTAVPMARLRRACHQAGLVATPRRRRYSTMLIWETLTGSDIRLHPGELAPHDRGDRSAYAAFRATDAPNIAELLAEEAERHLLRHRIDEPITWTPYPDPHGGPGGRGDRWCVPEPDLARRLSGWTAPSRAHTLRRSVHDHTPRSAVLVDEHYPLLPGLVSALWRFRPDRPPARSGRRHPYRGMTYSRQAEPPTGPVPLSVRDAHDIVGVDVLEPCNVGAAETYQLTRIGHELIDWHHHSICGPYEYDPWTQVADDLRNARTTVPPDHIYFDCFRLEPRCAREASLGRSPSQVGRDLAAASSTLDLCARPSTVPSDEPADIAMTRNATTTNCDNEAC